MTTARDLNNDLQKMIVGYDHAPYTAAKAPVAIPLTAATITAPVITREIGSERNDIKIAQVNARAERRRYNQENSCCSTTAYLHRSVFGFINLITCGHTGVDESKSCLANTGVGNDEPSCAECCGLLACCFCAPVYVAGAGVATVGTIPTSICDAYYFCKRSQNNRIDRRENEARAALGDGPLRQQMG